MAAGDLSTELVASYNVEITGIDRTRKEMAQLDGLIRQLRSGSYGPISVTVASQLGGGDVFVSKFDELTGRVQTKATRAMIEAMDFGKATQQAALRAATTPTGLSGKSHVGGRRGPGRDDSGAMIDAIQRNVETFKTASTTLITGWHGWGASRDGRFEYQEKGTNGRREIGSKSAKAKRAKASKQKGHPGVPAANSLGQAIIPTRETLRRKLEAI
jgi:hypothetical protein